jgi:hypothetical protein
MLVTITQNQVDRRLHRDFVPLEIPEGLDGKMKPKDWKYSATKPNKIVDKVTFNGVALDVASFDWCAAWGWYDGFMHTP